MASFIAGSGLSAYRTLQHRLPATTIGLQINGIADGVPYQIAIIFLFQ
ncbi:MAG: hypothetical protein E7K70_11285 [Klebsiella sp.]|uniref:Uncharacterized protein n=1 Tax=Klebsiella michiganensis TaxID=1134687 RepID=A0AAJ1NT74_9ENTR|nr:hypothetical protein [Klebsiella michiganensis]MDH0965175.1 hypothetical protein [Klebsiella michiganensis]MDU7527619.1 hypothetical protein [Klebsiella sp.]